MKLLLGVGITTIIWLLATYLTPPTDMKVLKNFVIKIRPGGPGWKKVSDAIVLDDKVTGSGEEWDVPKGVLAMVVGSLTVYSILFGIGFWIYNNYFPAILLSLIAAGGAYILVMLAGKLKLD